MTQSDDYLIRVVVMEAQVSDAERDMKGAKVERSDYRNPDKPVSAVPI